MGPLVLDLSLELAKPWTVIFGPSGAGKSTILRFMAGLLKPESGRVALRPGGAGEIVLTDTAERRFIPAHRRGVRMVAQRPALFPHISARSNVQFGMRSKDGGERLARVLEMCRIEHVLGKWPAELSGGERQRVALARALAAGRTELLLLDEPFTGLESSLRDSILQELRAWTEHEGTPVVLVTHDLREAFLARAEVVMLEAGRVTAQGAAEVVLAEERRAMLQLLHADTGAKV